jgi:hypothetical protein
MAPPTGFDPVLPARKADIERIPPYFSSILHHQKPVRAVKSRLKSRQHDTFIPCPENQINEIVSIS